MPGRSKCLIFASMQFRNGSSSISAVCNICSNATHLFSDSKTLTSSHHITGYCHRTARREDRHGPFNIARGTCATHSGPDHREISRNRFDWKYCQHLRVDSAGGSHKGFEGCRHHGRNESPGCTGGGYPQDPQQRQARQSQACSWGCSRCSSPLLGFTGDQY